VAVLMQLHRYYGSAPALTASSGNGHPRRMQKHSLVACTAYLMTNQLKRHRSSHKKRNTMILVIFMPFLIAYLSPPY
ncbi:TPA: hypothetical protein ACG1AX_003197, partial [Escherichia coli]